MADPNQQQVLRYLNLNEAQAAFLEPMIHNYDDYQRLRAAYYSLNDDNEQMSSVQDGLQTDEARQDCVEILVAYALPPFSTMILSPDLPKRSLQQNFSQICRFQSY